MTFILFRDNKIQSQVLVNYSSKLDSMIAQQADAGILKNTDYIPSHINNISPVNFQVVETFHWKVCLYRK